VCRHGAWYGNDTLWRMVLDLNKILLYANGDGTLREDHWHNAKRYFTIVDGIYAGEGDGPLSPDKREAGLIVAGGNPVAVDCTCARLMGFDYRKIPHLAKAFEAFPCRLCTFAYDDICVRSNVPDFDKHLRDIDREATLHFMPHFGWKNHIELTGDA
jgi:hypothetical protein